MVEMCVCGARDGGSCHGYMECEQKNLNQKKRKKKNQDGKEGTKTENVTLATSRDDWH